MMQYYESRTSHSNSESTLQNFLLYDSKILARDVKLPLFTHILYTSLYLAWLSMKKPARL